MDHPSSASHSRHGSGGALRRLAEAALSKVREIDALIASTPKTPVDFDLELMGNKVLLFLDEEGFVLHAYSAVPGNGYRFVGPATPKAGLFTKPSKTTGRPLVFPGASELERQKLLDYIFNFKYVLFDLEDQSFRPLDPPTATRIIFSSIEGKMAVSPVVQEAALGGF